MLFGEIDGLSEGDLFRDQRELFALGFHGDRQQGIHGRQSEGAESVILSGGYEDDKDSGDIILYTGMTPGTWDSERKTTKGHQTLTGKNKALAVNKDKSIPVRVFRSSKHVSPWSPKAGIVYSGLYAVTDYWKHINLEGHVIYRFRLFKLSKLSDIAVPRVQVTREEVARYRKHAINIKEMYEYSCQICGLSIGLPTGPYCECAHIMPLGFPHNGPDKIENILCLCPNHHVMLDAGALSILDDLTLIGLKGSLRVISEHRLDRNMLKYHREHIYHESSE
ncbi:hypothetical protein CCB80_00290 [Armatimonadetes bacterium Uphvl-Ar1]|nr:hypothetical protein CCB80_00290 [Armatimonadetes bacterium Uphvl-Ar1]